MAVQERSQPWVVVVCDVCGEDFRLSTRNALEWRQRGTPPRCRTCRRPAKPLTAAEHYRLEAWWVRRLGSREAAVELARGIWGA